jgi:hypothetical protein
MLSGTSAEIIPIQSQKKEFKDRLALFQEFQVFLSVFGHVDDVLALC